MTEFGESENWELCGVSYRATGELANEIMSLVMATAEWEDYAIASDLVHCGMFDATTTAGRDLVIRRNRAYKAAFVLTKAIVEQVLEQQRGDSQ